MANKKNEYYIDHKELRQKLADYYKKSDAGDADIPEDLGQMLLKIATGLSFASNFANYSFRQDMLGDALVKMVQAVQNQKFKVDSTFNPFAYFTTIAYHAFVNRIKKEKKHQIIVDAYQEKMYNELLIEQCEDCEGVALTYNENDDDDF